MLNENTQWDAFAKSIASRERPFKPNDLWGNDSLFADFVRAVVENPTTLIPANEIGDLDRKSVFKRLRTHFQDTEYSYKWLSGIEAAINCVAKMQGKDELDRSAESFFGEANTNFNSIYGRETFEHLFQAIPKTSRAHNRYQSFLSDDGGLPNIGYWITSEIIERSYHRGNDKVKKAVVPLIFAVEEDRKGIVLWLNIELDTTFPGPIYPDVASLGLLNVSKIIDPITEVWCISGLAESYRCRWHLTRKHPNFACSVKPNVLDNPLIGDSIQAATLIGLWAASGRIPRIDEDCKYQTMKYLPFDCRGVSLMVRPNIAISAELDFDKKDLRPADSSIRLLPINCEQLKITAASEVDRISADSSPFFDTIILCTKNKCEFPELRKGITVNTEPTDLAQVLELMLEHNYLKHCYDDSPCKAWEDLWSNDSGCYANMEQEWLNHKGKYKGS